MTTQHEALPLSDPTEELKFFVNEEEVVYEYQKSPDRRGYVLTVEQILTSAGFVPVDGFELTRDSDGQTFYSPEDEVTLELGEHFTATYKGQTPVS
jgi:hypothetical protein